MCDLYSGVSSSMRLLFHFGTFYCPQKVLLAWPGCKFMAKSCWDTGCRQYGQSPCSFPLLDKFSLHIVEIKAFHVPVGFCHQKVPQLQAPAIRVGLSYPCSASSLVGRGPGGAKFWALVRSEPALNTLSLSLPGYFPFDRMLLVSHSVGSP